MRTLRLITIILIFSALLCGISYSATDTMPSIDLTAVGMGARPIAMGGAYASIADDASAVFTNPAGLATQNRFSFVSMSTRILTSIDYQLFGIAYPTQWGNFGVGYASLSTPAGQYIYTDGVVTTEGGEMNYSNSMFIVSYGFDATAPMRETVGLEEDYLKNFSVGINLKVLSQGLSGGGINKAPNASGYAVDLGTLYSMNDRLTLGAEVQNISSSLSWSTEEKEVLDKSFKFGASYKVFDNLSVTLQSDFDMDGIEKMTMHGGCEYWVIPQLALRTGLDQKNQSIDDETTDITTDYSLGIGFLLSGFRFDYAYRLDSAFNEFSSQYFSICYSGDPIQLPKQADETSIARYEDLIEGIETEE